MKKRVYVLKKPSHKNSHEFYKKSDIARFFCVSRQGIQKMLEAHPDYLYDYKVTIKYVEVIRKTKKEIIDIIFRRIEVNWGDKACLELIDAYKGNQLVTKDKDKGKEDV